MKTDPEKLFADLAHGDDEHREWLHEAILAHVNGQPVPETRGGSAKDVLIVEQAAQLQALAADKADKQERIDILEAELSEAAAVLQKALPIGEVKHIGLREVAAGVELLAADKERLEGDVERLREACRAALECSESMWGSRLNANSKTGKLHEQLRAALAPTQEQP